MSHSEIPPKPLPACSQTYLPLDPPPPGPPDAIIIPEGQLAELLPAGLLEAMEEEGPSVALDPRWKAARDAFLTSLDEQCGALIFQELCKQIAAQKDGAKESAKDLHQKVRLIACRLFDDHYEKTGEAWAPKNPEAYFRTVSQNVAKNHFRVKARKPAIARGVEADASESPWLDPEEAAQHAQLLEIFKRKGGTLTPQEEEVFQGRVLGMTFGAIAAVLKRPLSTVHAQSERAKEKIKALVDSHV